MTQTSIFKTIFSALGLLSSLLAVASTSGPSTESLIKNYQLLDSVTRVRVHQNLMRVLSMQARKTKYDHKTIQENFTSSFEKKTENSHYLLNLFVNEAIAGAENPEMFCNFGGWISTFNSEQECQPPWRSVVRDDARLEIFGPTYSRKYSCGGANLFRCNPTVFGPGEDGLGICATADDSDPQSSTTACREEFNKMDPQAIANFVDGLSSEPEKLTQYLGTLAETLRFCRNTNNAVSYCDPLITDMLNVKTKALLCTDQMELIKFLPDVITPFNIDELNSITNQLGNKARAYRASLERRIREAREINRQVYEKAIIAYQNLPVVQDTMERIKDNSSKCLMGSCEGTGYRTSKPSHDSLAWCARYVKLAMFPPSDNGKEAFGDFSEYPWGSDAVESGDWLRREGLVNLMDIPEMRHLTPETAPIGSFIVYDKPAAKRRYNVDGVNRGGPGHIEMKTAANEYVSDFINDEPTTVGGERRPIGIYVKIPPEFKDQLQVVPQR